MISHSDSQKWKKEKIKTNGKVYTQLNLKTGKWILFCLGNLLESYAAGKVLPMQYETMLSRSAKIFENAPKDVMAGIRHYVESSDNEMVREFAFLIPALTSI